MILKNKEEVIKSLILSTGAHRKDCEFALNLKKGVIRDAKDYLLNGVKLSTIKKKVLECKLCPTDNEGNKCVNGCKHFTGGELRHHKDCPNY